MDRYAVSPVTADSLAAAKDALSAILALHAPPRARMYLLDGVVALLNGAVRASPGLVLERVWEWDDGDNARAVVAGEAAPLVAAAEATLAAAGAGGARSELSRAARDADAHAVTVLCYAKALREELRVELGKALPPWAVSGEVCVACGANHHYKGGKDGPFCGGCCSCEEWDMPSSSRVVEHRPPAARPLAAVLSEGLL